TATRVRGEQKRKRKSRGGRGKRRKTAVPPCRGSRGRGSSLSPARIRPPRRASRTPHRWRGSRRARAAGTNELRPPPGPGSPAAAKRRLSALSRLSDKPRDYDPI